MEIRGKRGRRLGKDRMKDKKNRRANGGGKVPFEVVSETAMLLSPQKNGPGWT